MKRLLFCVLSACLLAGCGEEEKIARQAIQRPNDMPRLLAAMIPAEKPNTKAWTFKLSDRDTVIEGMTDDFQRFLRSIKFVAPDTPSWELPKGWTELKDKPEKASKNLYALIRAGADAKAPVLVVSAMSGVRAGPGFYLVNQWRIELGFDDMLAKNEKNVRAAIAELEDYPNRETLAGIPSLVVDLTGPKLPPQEMADEPVYRDPPFDYRAPPAWEEIAPKELSILSFAPTDPKQRVTITVSESGGGLVANVNRWRDQVGALRLTPEQIKALPRISIGNKEAYLTDFKGGAEAPPMRNRIYGAILYEDSGLFFKMIGPSEDVERQIAPFLTFLESIRLR